MDFQSLIQPVEAELKKLDAIILDHLDTQLPFIKEVSEYIISGGGKRLRPLTAILMARALGYDKDDRAILLGGIIELLHTATLLHDDVVDNSQMRRKKPTVNEVWGNSAAVLVGDFLISRTYQMSVRTRNIDVMQILADSSNTIAEGEVMQLLSVRNAGVTEDMYNRIIYCKTAKLFECASESAAVLAEADQQKYQAAVTYGVEMGSAFQLVDDVLDYVGSAEEIGKNLGDDLAEGKPTLPIIYALNHGDETDRKRLGEIIKAGDASAIDEVTQIIHRCDALSYTRDRIQRHVDGAKAALEIIGDNIYSQTLAKLADFTMSRSS